MSQQFFVNARMVIIRNGKLLMGYEGNKEPEKQHWETPGGSIEIGEDLICGLKREAMEELGAEIRIADSLPFFFNHNNPKSEKYKDQHWMIIYFVCKLESEPDLNNAKDIEFTELKYIDKSEFAKLNKDNKIMMFDVEYIPDIMKKLKMW